jgi:hypothetical protein
MPANSKSPDPSENGHTFGSLHYTVGELLNLKKDVTEKTPGILPGLEAAIDGPTIREVLATPYSELPLRITRKSSDQERVAVRWRLMLGR